jgi:phage anti-repressor protein
MDFKTFLLDSILQEDEKIDSEFIEEFAFTLKSDDKFPINIELLVKWGVDAQKKHAIKRVEKHFKECIDFSRTFGKSTGGRPATSIMLTVDCFKEMRMLAQNDKGKTTRLFYLILERLWKKYMEIEFSRQKEENERLKEDLHEEQLQGIKQRKCIGNYSYKNRHRHQFSLGPCVYVLQNPDNLLTAKFGLTNNINQRLAQDRTMIPELVLKAVMYTPCTKLFEDVIKHKYDHQLIKPAHEWVTFDDIDVFLQDLRDIDRVCGFESVSEVSIWKYNLTEPPAPNELVVNFIDDCNKDKIYPTLIECLSERYSKETDNLLKYTILAERVTNLLPTRLLRVDMLKKNNSAPNGERYCNGWCQKYRSVLSFTKSGVSLSTICSQCKSMEDVASIKINNGELTAEKIRNNPMLILLKSNEKICRTCKEILDVDDFEAPKRQCKKCRYRKEKERVRSFELVIEKEVDILRKMEYKDRAIKIKKYIKDELIKIMKYLKTGRKSSDKKDDMINKILAFLSEE